MYRLAAIIALTGVFSAAAPGQVRSDPPQRPFPKPLPRSAHHEVPTQEYVPVAPEDILTSPAYAEGRGRYTSVQVNVNASGQNILNDAANEPSLAIDPTNRQRMVIGWRQFDSKQSSFRQAGWAYSHNGGKSWTFAGKIEPGVFGSDPVLEVSPTGVFYYDSLRTGGGYNCKLYKSYDGGMTWDTGVNARGGDKQWVVVDRTGSVGHGNIYSVWNLSFSSCNGQFTRSTNGGSSFESCTFVDGDPYWGTMAVGPDGELYIASDGMFVAKSENAKNAGQSPTWTYQMVDLGGTLMFSAGPNPGGLLGQAYVCTDVSLNATRGNVYLLASVDGLSNPMDVMFSRSTDGGQTWSTAVRINDDGASSGAWHWFGTMSVAPNGRIDVVWLDTRNHVGTYLSELFYSYSEDGGLTWSANVQVSNQFNPHVGWPQQNKIGDYYGMVSFNAGAHVAYSATFNNEQDVFYLYLPRYALGDLNCDGELDFGDINPFVQVMTDVDGYAADHPNCDFVLADINDNGTVGFDDINPFVQLLSGL